jgi:hypothetical protein
MITLTNDFHNTSIRVRPHGNFPARISPSQTARIRRALCPVYACSCGDALGTRGPQFTDAGQRLDIQYGSGPDDFICRAVRA